MYLKGLKLSAAARLNLNSISFRLVESRDTLVEENIGLARAVAAKFVKKGRVEDSEFYSVACLELVRAAETFDSSKSAFSTWATKMMTNGILSEIRKSKCRKAVSLDDLRDVSRDQKEELPLQIVDSMCKDESCRILTRHYVDGESLAEIGRSLGISREGARKRLAKAISLARENYKSIVKEYAE
jgi:RNA polymerase sigma factor (sigma-70 family)